LRFARYLGLSAMAMGLAVALLLPTASRAEGDFYPPLYEALARQLSADSLRLTTAPPLVLEDGVRFERFFLEARGIRIDGMRIEELTAAALGAVFNREEEWRKTAEMRSAELATLRMRVLEKDVNDFFLLKYPPGRRSGWLFIRFDLKDGWIRGEGLYKFSGLPFRTHVVLEGKLEVVRGRKVYVSDYTMRVDGLEIPRSRAEPVVNRIQPLLDLDKLAFPGRLSRVEVREDSLLVETSPSPESLR